MEYLDLWDIKKKLKPSSDRDRGQLEELKAEIQCLRDNIAALRTHEGRISDQTPRRGPGTVQQGGDVIRYAAFVLVQCFSFSVGWVIGGWILSLFGLHQ